MNLLYIDRPLVINPALAEKIGLNEAIVLQQMHYWLDKTTSGREHDGKTWIYNTYEQWAEQFPFWSESTIKRIINSLKNKGLIKVKQLNKQTHDRTNYYTIAYESANLFDSAKMTRSIGANCPDPQCQNGTLSTEITTEITTENLKPLSCKQDDAAKDAVERSLIDYLNQLTGRNYRPAASNIRLLRARLAEGYTAQEIADVIARKCAEWIDDPKMAQYLRPATLFNAEKFNTYVGQLDMPLPAKSSGSNHENRHSGFDEKNYTNGLIEQEDGTYAF